MKKNIILILTCALFSAALSFAAEDVQNKDAQKLMFVLKEDGAGVR